MYHQRRQIAYAFLILLSCGFLACERETEHLSEEMTDVQPSHSGLRAVILPVSQIFEEASQLPPGEILTLRIPKGRGEFWDLELQRGDILSPDFKVEEWGASGVSQVSSHDFVYLYGISHRGRANEEVRVVLSQDLLYAHIPENGKSYEVWPLAATQKQAEVGMTLVGEEQAFIAQGAIPSIHCSGAAEPEQPQGVEFAPGPDAFDKGRAACWKAQVLAQADFEYHAQSGYDTQVGSFVVVVNVVRADEKLNPVGVDLLLTGVTILTAPQSPLYYPVSTDIDTLLKQTRNGLNYLVPATNRDFAVLFTGKNLGSRAGLAYFDVVCNQPDYACAVVSNRFGYPQSMLLLAHEIGHLFGARHLDEFPNGFLCPGYSPIAWEIMNSRIFLYEQIQYSTCSVDEIKWHVFFNNQCLHQAACN